MMRPQDLQGYITQIQNNFTAEQQALQSRYNQQIQALKQGLISGQGVPQQMQQNYQQGMAMQPPVQPQQYQQPMQPMQQPMMQQPMQQAPVEQQPQQQQPSYPDAVVTSLNEIRGLLGQMIAQQKGNRPQQQQAAPQMQQNQQAQQQPIQQVQQQVAPSPENIE